MTITVTTSGVSTNYGSTLSGTLDVSGETVVNITVPLQSPFVVVLNSSGSPAITFNLDQGTTANYYSAPNLVTSGSDQIYSVITFPVTQLKFVGDEGDTWYIVQ